MEHSVRKQRSVWCQFSRMMTRKAEIGD